MKFARKTVSLAARIGVTVSVVVALIVAAVIYSDEAQKAAAAEQMLKNGVTVKAVPTYASASTTKRRRGGSSTTYTIRYAFPDAQMRHVDGQDVATQNEFDALVDPDNPSLIRRDATVDIVYDRANPSRNGLKSRFESESSPDLVNIGTAFAAALFVALLVVGYIYSFMKKRIAPESTVAPAPVSQSPIMR